MLKNISLGLPLQLLGKYNMDLLRLILREELEIS